jgi:hypothetical protein
MHTALQLRRHMLWVCAVLRAEEYQHLQMLLSTACCWGVLCMRCRIAEQLLAQQAVRLGLADAAALAAPAQIFSSIFAVGDNPAADVRAQTRPGPLGCPCLCAPACFRGLAMMRRTLHMLWLAMCWQQCRLGCIGQEAAGGTACADA